MFISLFIFPVWEKKKKTLCRDESRAQNGADTDTQSDIHINTQPHMGVWFMTNETRHTHPRAHKYYQTTAQHTCDRREVHADRIQLHKHTTP